MFHISIVPIDKIWGLFYWLFHLNRPLISRKGTGCSLEQTKNLHNLLSITLPSWRASSKIPISIRKINCCCRWKGEWVVPSTGDEVGGWVKREMSVRTYSIWVFLLEPMLLQVTSSLNLQSLCLHHNPSFRSISRLGFLGYGWQDSCQRKKAVETP